MSKKFRFKLQPALDQAAERKADQGRVLQQRLEVEKQARQHLEMLNQRCDARARDLDELRALPLSAVGHLGLHGERDDALLAAMKACEEECEKQRRELSSCERMVEDAREELAKTLAELRQFERLKEKAQEEFHSEERRREESERDEAAVLRHRHRSSPEDDEPRGPG